MSERALLQTVRTTLAREPRVRRHLPNIDLGIEDGTLLLSGAVDDIAAKRLARRIAVACSGGNGVIDRIRLRCDATPEDASLEDSVRTLLAGEPVFAAYGIASGEAETMLRTGERDDPVAGRAVQVRASAGVVTLAGTVESLSHKRIAEALAWWVPGTADVDNRLHVSPAEQDSDDEIADAARLVLEKDPWIDAGHIGIHARDRVVTLTGTLPGEEQKRMAQNNVWYLPGVHDVINRITTAEWEWQDQCADEASRESFPASDPPSMTPVIGIGGRRDEVVR